MILADQEILKAMNTGDILISPFRPECLGSNSYDVHLGSTLAVYDTNNLLDARVHNPVRFFEMEEDGYILTPGRLYLGVTEEYTETKGLVPFLEGKSFNEFTEQNIEN